jgi:hypothetical protein
MPLWLGHITTDKKLMIFQLMSFLFFVACARVALLYRSAVNCSVGAGICAPSPPLKRTLVKSPYKEQTPARRVSGSLKDFKRADT